MTVKGPWMQRLGDYVRGGDPRAIEAMVRSWERATDRFDAAGNTMISNAGRVEDGFSDTSLSGPAARRDMETSGKETNKKRDVLEKATAALWIVRDRMKEAQEAHKALEATLPATHDPVPPESTFNTTPGGGTSAAQAKLNQQDYADAKNAHAEREAAIADAERIAAEKVQAVDVSVEDAEPKVRALYDDGSDSNALPPGTSSQPGSASQVAASRARMAKYNSGTLYPDGWGHELIAQEKANITGYEAENKPEWNGTEWVNADGTLAPATSYAMVETADGLAPLSGGTGGMAALAVAGGGALLSAGVAKAIASKFGAGSAKAATAGATSRSATAKSAAAKAGAAGARAGAGAGAGARGAGARGAGAAGGRGTGAGARGAGAGGRGTGRGGAGGRGGTGAAGGRGGKNRDKNGSQNQEWEADYTDDWTETASDVLDPNASLGWVPNATQGVDSGNTKDDRT